MSRFPDDNGEAEAREWLQRRAAEKSSPWEELSAGVTPARVAPRPPTNTPAAVDVRTLPPVVIGDQAVRLYFIGAGFNLLGPYGCYATVESLAAALAALPHALRQQVIPSVAAPESQPNPFTDRTCRACGTAHISHARKIQAYHRFVEKVSHYFTGNQHAVWIAHQRKTLESELADGATDGEGEP